MPLKVTDLKPGDRVMLNCPKSQVARKREAQFEGIFQSIADAMERGGTHLLMPGATAVFLSGGAWARFLLQRQGGLDLVAAFLIEEDGGMREEQGRRVFIEQRLTMGMG